METFVENLTKQAVVTASANAESNVYALALGAYNTLTDKQKKVFEVAYNAYQRKIYIAVDYRTQKNTRKEIKANGIPFVSKYARVVTHFDNYVSLVQKENPNFVEENRKWGERVNDVAVYYNGNLYLSMKPTWTPKAKYTIPTTEGNEMEISYAEEQDMLCPSARDDYKSQKTAERQGVSAENIVRCADIRIENIRSIKCGSTIDVNEFELTL